VLQNQFPDLPLDLDELEFPAQRLDVDCVFDPDLHLRPLDRRHKQPEVRFRSPRANPVGSAEEVRTLNYVIRDSQKRDDIHFLGGA
jgi:hypothetical protein